MSVYESLARASLKVKRRLFDYNISIVGKEVKAVLIHQEEDIYHDFSDPDILDTKVITAVINFPSEVPLERYRVNGKVTNNATRTYFYEVLPVEIYLQLKDHMEVDDFIFFFLEDEQNNKIPFLLQLTDTFGKFEIGMYWRKFYGAPYNGSDISKIIPYLEEHVIAKVYDTYQEENPESSYLMTADEMEEYHNEPFKNLFINPLNPMEQTISFDSSLVVQCAFGSMLVEGYRTVTPDSPLRIIVDRLTVVNIIPSSDCKYPSVYSSEFFHPFVVDKKENYALTFPFNFETLDITFDFKFANFSGISPVIVVEMGSGTTIITENYSLVGDYSIQKTRPLFYVEDDTHFLSLSLNYNKEIVLGGKTSTGTINHTFGVQDSLTEIHFALSGETMTITIGEEIQMVDGLGVFEGKHYYIGYEKEKYINDFIRQIYF